LSHFNDIELHRWSRSGPGEDGPRMRAHLAVCADCSRRYAAAIRQTALQADPATDADDFIRRGRRLDSTAMRWLLPAIAAAFALFLVALPFMWRRSEPRSDIRLRSGAVETIAPSGTVAPGRLELSWASGVDAARYRVEIGTADQVVFTSTAVRSPFAVPDQWRARLRPGSDYWWTVTALDAQGEPVATSRRRTFAISQ